MTTPAQHPAAPASIPEATAALQPLVTELRRIAMIHAEVPAAESRRWIVRGLLATSIGGVALLAAGQLWWWSLALLVTMGLSAIIHEILLGLNGKSYLWRQALLLLTSGWQEWLRLAMAVALLVMAVVVLDLLVPSVVILIISIAIAAAVYYTVDGPLDIERRQPAAEAHLTLSDLRQAGASEASIRRFVYLYAGDQWEEFYEMLFGYEAKLVARRRWNSGELQNNRPEHAAWRDPIAQWINTRLARLGALHPTRGHPAVMPPVIAPPTPDRGSVPPSSLAPSPAPAPAPAPAQTEPKPAANNPLVRDSEVIESPKPPASVRPSAPDTAQDAVVPGSAAAAQGLQTLSANVAGLATQSPLVISANATPVPAPSGAQVVTIATGGPDLDVARKLAFAQGVAFAQGAALGQAAGQNPAPGQSAPKPPSNTPPLRIGDATASDFQRTMDPRTGWSAYVSSLATLARSQDHVSDTLDEDVAYVTQEAASVRGIPWVTRQHDGLLGALLSPGLRFLLAAILLAGFLVWRYQNRDLGDHAAQSDPAVTSVADLPDGTPAPVTAQAPASVAPLRPLRIAVVPPVICDVLGSWGGGVAGLVLLISSIISGTGGGMLMYLAAGTIVAGSRMQALGATATPHLELIAIATGGALVALTFVLVLWPAAPKPPERPSSSDRPG